MRPLNVLFMTSWYPTRAQPVRGIFVREHAKAVRLYDRVVVLHLPGPETSPPYPPLPVGEGDAKAPPPFQGGGRGEGRTPTHQEDRRAAAPLWWLEREADETLAEGIPTYRACYRVSPVPKTSYFVYLWNALRGFRRIVRDGFRPDVIHAHVYEAGVPAVLIGKLYGIPVVVAEHFSAFTRRALPSGELRKARFAFRWARWVLPVSATLQRSIEEYGIRARFQVVPNPVDDALFAGGARSHSPHDPIRLLYVGALVAPKGVPYLLEALARLDQEQPGSRCQLDVVGDGPEREAYARRAAELGLSDRVTFHGARSKAEVAAFMHQADLFVLPSLVETFSVATAEALTAGLPVLATACGGPEEFVTPEVGRLVPPGDAGALYRGLREMLAVLPSYAPAFISAYAVERFSPQRVGAVLHAIYGSL